MLKTIWLGQGGFHFSDGELSVMVDPYLSDSLFRSRGEDFRRMLPVREDFFLLDPDVLVLTHGHGDHADEETLVRVLSSRKRMDVLCPSGVYPGVRKEYGSRHNVVLFDRGTEWTAGGVTLRAVRAVHSDPSPIGLFFTMAGETVWVTGDTLYSRDLVTDMRAAGIPVDWLYVCINGMGNNMNAIDAARLAQAVGPGTAVPMHWGMFERFSADPGPFMTRMRELGIRTLRLEYGIEFDSAAVRSFGDPCPTGAAVSVAPVDRACTPGGGSRE